jgi:flagellar assembly protein FliH
MAGRRRIPAIVWDAVSEARICREEASREAEQILSRAREGARTIQATAERRGREEGLASVSEAHVGAVLARDRLLEAARSELVDLAFDIAERVIGEVVRRHPEVVAEVAGRALEVSRGKVEVVVRANPSDLCEIQHAEGPLLETTRATERIRFVPDPSLVRGGVVIDTELGRVDASIAAQLSGLRRALDEARGGEGR